MCFEMHWEISGLYLTPACTICPKHLDSNSSCTTILMSSDSKTNFHIKCTFNSFELRFYNHGERRPLL